MQTANEIRAAVENIRYYAGRIALLTRQQLDADCEQGNRLGMSSLPGSIRFDCLGAIAAACTHVGIYCDNILANLKTAEKQDKLLYKQEEEEQPELADEEG